MSPSLRISVYGYARGCPVGRRELTLSSKAFSPRQEFAGAPAIYADIRLRVLR